MESEKFLPNSEFCLSLIRDNDEQKVIGYSGNANRNAKSQLKIAMERQNVPMGVWEGRNASKAMVSELE